MLGYGGGWRRRARGSSDGGPRRQSATPFARPIFQRGRARGRLIFFFYISLPSIYSVVIANYCSRERQGFVTGQSLRSDYNSLFKVHRRRAFAVILSFYEFVNVSLE